MKATRVRESVERQLLTMCTAPSPQQWGGHAHTMRDVHSASDRRGPATRRVAVCVSLINKARRARVQVRRPGKEMLATVRSIAFDLLEEIF
ncbi:hypothetical protein AB0G73_23910 [Streptomyces sp. NPDC020719]|uniref:hypothetical protein n=1 Tax=Streptomyces sp. NPDC020719 TaxID=3154896 RepID=UPI0034093D9B